MKTNALSERKYSYIWLFFTVGLFELKITRLNEIGMETRNVVIAEIMRLYNISFSLSYC